MGFLVRLAVITLVVLALGCGGPSSPSQPPPSPSPTPSPSPSPSPTPLPGTFTISGNPAGAAGATWTYQAVISGVTYDLQGILFRPAGNGPFGAVIVSHGTGGNAYGYSTTIARTMVDWGLVVIATHYTHAGGVPIGSPGFANEIGASSANIARARQMVELLRSLGYVDMNRLAAHGHSGGAFITSGLLGASPGLFRVASHTAGGARLDTQSAAVPSASHVSAIRAPYQLHHGENDQSVPLASEQLLASILLAQGVPHELYVYPGAGHNDVGLSAVMFDRVRAWYSANGMQP
jgi:dienelactone hydrolase